jgi:signal transduction histidine kinase
MPISRVLILSTNPAFAREVSAHWPDGTENQREFTVLDQALVRDLDASQYDLAIVDASFPDSHFAVKKALAATGKPAILIHADNSLPFSSVQGTITELRGQDGLWPVVAGLIGREILGRCQAEARARNAETGSALAQAEATLGRYMVEMRHNVNNALTSVLGNAELLSLEPGLPAKTRVQADTILNMALRLHEVFQRFSSLEKELSVAAREAGKSSPHPRATAAGR